MLYAYVAYDQKTLIVTPAPDMGVSFGTSIFALITVIYNLVFLKPLKRYNLWIAYLVSYALVNVTNAAVTELTLHTSIGHVFIGMTYLFSVLSITLGPLVGLSVLAISGIITGMAIAGTIDPTPLGTNTDAAAYVARVLIITLGLYLLRNRYTTSSGRQNYIERYFVTNEVVSLLTDSISDGVIIIDQKGIVRSVNPAILKLLGQKADDILELDYKSILKLKNSSGGSIDPAQEPVAVALQSKTGVSKEYVLATGESEVYVDITVSAIADPATKDMYGAVIIVRDVSKKKQEENARSEFISTASHEMRTPVAAIEGFIELALSEKVSTVDDRARKYLEKARASAQHLGRLFQDLLVSAKAEDGRLSNHPVVIELSELLEQQAEVSKISAQQKGLELDFVVSSGDQPIGHEGSKVIKPLYYVLADPDRIREIATNLIDNAIKYTPAGKVTLGVTANQEVVQFFIRDTGVGIAAEDVPHLFQKFYRVDSSDTRTTGGTGLGLYICREIVDLYHGRVWAESEKGKGTTFYVNLPRMTTAQAEATLAKQQVQTGANKSS